MQRTKLRVVGVVGVVLVALAAPGPSPVWAGPVSGKLELPTQGPARPPVRAKGFLQRTENPIAPVRPVDPLPMMVVVLEGTVSGAPAPQAATWDLLGESFNRP